jgi:AAA family ATP:ADP antiporter
MRSFLCRALGAEPHELPALGWAFGYFFLLLSSYYILRPLRDEMAVQAGASQLQWLFTATFVTMLALVPVFGWLCARFSRARLLPAVYLFFALNLVAFWAAVRAGISPRNLAAVFFVWLSVFNLFVVSVFWSFMADLFDDAQAARLYAAIAAGGSCGAIAGPALTALAVSQIGAANLLIISGVLLVAAVGCIHELLAWARRHPRKGEARAEEPIGGSIVEGVRAALSSPYLLGICAYLLCYTTLSTTLYFQQVEIVRGAVPDSNERTRLFATIDLAVNSLTLIVQLLLTARLGAALGIGWMLALMPIASLFGFAWLGAVPTLAVLIVFGVTRRVGEFAISKPVREALYTVVPREERYKAKNFIDTVIYRGGDAFSGWLIAALRLGVSGIAFAALPVAAGWIAVSFWLGRKQRMLRAKMNP